MPDNPTLPELPPATAALAAAIERVDQAARLLDAAHRPLAGLEADKTAAHCEVMELRVAIAAVRAPPALPPPARRHRST